MAKDRYARGQGPRTQAQVLSKKKGLHKIFSGDLKQKKRSSQKFSMRSLEKNFSQKIFQALHKILTMKKKCCPRADNRPIFEDMRPRGQGLDFRGQGLENVSSRSRTSSRTPPLLRTNKLPQLLIYRKTAKTITTLRKHKSQRLESAITRTNINRIGKEQVKMLYFHNLYFPNAHGIKNLHPYTIKSSTTNKSFLTRQKSVKH